MSIVNLRYISENEHINWNNDLWRFVSKAFNDRLIQLLEKRQKTINRESLTNTVSILNLNTVVEIDISTEIMIRPGYVSNAFNDRDIQLLEKRHNTPHNTLNPLKTRKMRLG